MSPDMCVPCGDGLINVRVGALIVRDGKFLMVANDRLRHVYTVGGRIKMGERAEKAIVREVFEETGVHMTVDRLAFVHELYFPSENPRKDCKLVYELSFIFLMNVPPDFEPDRKAAVDLCDQEYLTWVAPDDPRTVYPEFFRTDALDVSPGVTFYSTDERDRPNR